LIINARELATLPKTPQDWLATDSFLHWVMAMVAQVYMPDDVLVKVDRAAMANSLETLLPILI